MKKYKVLDLGIEVTRRCNKACPHCLRGNAQEVTISEKIIDRIIDGIDDVKSIRIGNGEALMEPERIEYLIRKINESGWNTAYVEITTNGSILDRRIIDAFELFCGASGHDTRVALIRVSNDQFHVKAEYEQAYSFYSSLATEVNERLRRKGVCGCICVEYVLRNDDQQLEGILYEGRGVDYINKGPDRYRSEGRQGYPYLYKHRICVSDNTVGCALMITAKGGVAFLEEVSYEHLDEMTIGNIVEDDLVDIVDHHNAECLFLCSEMDRLRVIDCYEAFGNFRPEYEGLHLDAYAKLCRLIFNRVLALRYKAKSIFPGLTAQAILERMKFPEDGEVLAIVIAMYGNCPEYDPKIAAKFNLELITQGAIGAHFPRILKAIEPAHRCSIYQEEMSAAVLRSVTKDPGILGRLHSLFQEDESILGSIFPDITDITDDNSAVMGCDMKQGSISGAEAMTDKFVRESYGILQCEEFINNISAVPGAQKIVDILQDNIEDAISQIGPIQEGELISSGGNGIETIVKRLLPEIEDALTKNGISEKLTNILKQGGPDRDALVQAVCGVRKYMPESAEDLQRIKEETQPVMLSLNLLETSLRLIDVRGGVIDTSDIGSFCSADYYIACLREQYRNLGSKNRELYCKFLEEEHHLTWQSLDETFTRYGLVATSPKEAKMRDKAYYMARITERYRGNKENNA